MSKSMTAYARGKANSPLGTLSVEILSVNRKMLDMSVYLPKDLLRFDIEIRKWLAKSLERGQVTLRVTLQAQGATDTLLSNQLPQLKSLKSGWEKVCHELHLDPQKMIDLPFLVSQLQTASAALSNADEEEIKSALKQAVDAALKDLMVMKEVEGKALALDIMGRLETLQECSEIIESKKEIPLAYYRKKLIDKLKEVGYDSGEAIERVAKEAALLAEKMDITEELVRLRTHLEQFKVHLASEKAIGRTLDFLTQEIHREINTLGSKSADSEISLYAVKMKAELDKIREQVQNIE